MGPVSQIWHNIYLRSIKGFTYRIVYVAPQSSKEIWLSRSGRNTSHKLP